jgi:hypothetical protein
MKKFAFLRITQHEIAVEKVQDRNQARLHLLPNLC